MGVKKSFFTLLKYAKAQYYFFCDQDDIWLSNKVTDTLQVLKEKEKGNVPVCVHTDLKIVDNELKVLHNSMIESQSLYKQDTLNNLLVQNSVTGCTMAINDELKYILSDRVNMNNIVMHDWWIALVAASFGIVELLDAPTILYRQHENNEVGAKTLIDKLSSGYGKKELLISIVKTFVQAKELKVCFGKELPLDKQERIQFYLSKVESNQLNLKWFNAYKKNGWLRNNMFRVLLTLQLSSIKDLYKNY